MFLLFTKQIRVYIAFGVSFTFLSFPPDSDFVPVERSQRQPGLVGTLEILVGKDVTEDCEVAEEGIHDERVRYVEGEQRDELPRRRHEYHVAWGRAG